MSYPRYPKYRDSGIEWLGEVPEGWDVYRMASLFREAIRLGDPALPVLSISIHDGITDEELSPEDRDRKVSQIEDKTKYKLVVPNDLAYNMMRAWQGAFGTVMVDGLVSPAYVVAEPTCSFRTGYIEQLLRTPMAIEEMRRFSRGIADFRMRLYWEYFRDLRVCLPPIHEQGAILEFISRETARIDALIEKKTRFIELLKEKRSALITHAVTKGLDPNVKMKDSGVEWLGEVPEHWQVKPIRRVLSSPLSNGIFKKKEEFGEGALLINVFDIYRQDFKVDFDSLDRVKCDPSEIVNYEVFANDLFFVRSSLKQEGIAVVAIAGNCSEPVVYECHLIRARPNRQVLNGHFGSYVLNSVVYRSKMVAKAKITTMTTIDQEAILSTELPLPSIVEQSAIAAFLDRETARIDALVEKTGKSIELLKERRSALITAAVTGKIDVRNIGHE